MNEKTDREFIREALQMIKLDEQQLAWLEGFCIGIIESARRREIINCAALLENTYPDAAKRLRAVHRG